MIRDLGIVQPGTTLYLPFHTFDSNDPTASVTLTGLATTDIEIYKDGSVTQRASDSGYALLDTDGIDFDGITGIHGLSIDLADNTTAGFYAAGSQYWVVISSITVDAATVNFLLATFRIGQPGAILNTTIATLSTQTSFTLTSGPAEDDALNGCIVRIHDVASAVQAGFAVVQDYTGSSKTVTLVAGTTFTAAATDNISFFPPTLVPTTLGRTLVVDAAGLADANVVKVGPTGSGTAQTARDIGGAVPAAAAGASGGLLISGSNAGTTTFAALTVTGATTLTGNVSMAAGLNITQSSSNTSALVITGNGTGHGAAITSGSGATGNAITLLAASTNGHGLKSTGTGTGDGAELTAGASGADLDADIAGTLTTVTNLTTNNDKTGYRLSATGVDDVWDEAQSGHTTAGTFGRYLDAQVANVETDTQDIQSRLPAALGANGNMKADVRDYNGTAGTFSSGRPQVILGDVAHGGTAAVLTLERIVVASTTTDEPGVKLTGNGTGAGLLSTGGAGGNGATFAGNNSTGSGIRGTGASGMTLNGAASDGLGINGAVRGLNITTDGGDTIRLAPTAGHGINIAANGTDKHGVIVTGGTAGTSDGIKAVAGTGGVPIRGDITGNITGNLVGTVSTLTTYTGNTPQTGDSFARLGAPAGASVSADIATKATPAQILTTALTESYNTDGAAPTLSQAAFVIMQMLTEMSISGTTMTIKKLDGSTTAFTLTLDSATTPTSVSRTT